MRAFLAVEIPSSITRRLSSVQQELPEGMKLVNSDAMHITLKFFGEITPGKANEISSAMDATEFSAFPLACKGLGVFPSRNFVRVAWAGIESPGLVELHKKLEPKLAGLGFQKEDFTPHLTIARAREKVRLDQLLDKYANEPFGDCLIDSFHLKKSTLTPHGPVYEDVHSVSVKH